MRAETGFEVCFCLIVWASWSHGAELFPTLSSGSVGWAVQSLEVASTATSFSVWLLRVGNSSGPLVVHVVVDDKNGGAGASSNLRFSGGPHAWVSGDDSPKEVHILVLNVSYLDEGNQVRLLIASTEPSGAQHETNHELHVQRATPNSGGYVEFNAHVVTTAEGHSAHIDECLLYATRARGLRERTGVSLTLVDCDFILNPASEGVDFMAESMGLETVWEPSESDTRCVLRKLDRMATSDVPGLIFFRDSLSEGIESICLRPIISPDSSTLSASLLIVLVQDNVNPPTYECGKGEDCILNCSNIVFDADNEVVVQSKGCDTCNATLSKWGMSYGRDCPISYGHLFDFENETNVYFVCECLRYSPSAPAKVLGKLSISGPFSNNIVSCIMGSPVCKVELQETNPDLVNEFVQVVSYTACRDFNSTPSGFQFGAHANISPLSTKDVGVYFLNDPIAMAYAEAGIYQICWCRQSETRNCSDRSDISYSVSAGLFLFSGPYDWGDQVHILGGRLSLEGVTGVQLSSNDHIALQRKCGHDDHPWSLVSRAAATSGLYEFGVVDMDRVLASTYQLCWCQPHIYQAKDGTSGEIKCDRPSDFVSPFGEIHFRCHDRYADAEGDGHCDLCIVWTTPDLDHVLCETDSVKISFLVYSLLAGISFVFVCFLENGIGFNRYGRKVAMRGREMIIADITTQQDDVIITTNTNHQLCACAGSVPILLEGTGCYELDSIHGEQKGFRAKVESAQRLKLLREDNRPVSFKAESSLGTLALQFGSGMLHSFVLNSVPVPVCLCFLFVTALVIRIIMLARQDANMFFIFFLVDFLGGACLRLLHGFWIFSQFQHRNYLHASLAVYRARLLDRNPHPSACERGPPRAVTAFQLLDLHEFFVSFINVRTMYYLDYNIVRQLTKKFELSYAEVAGPSMVEWFVSHYWGTPFRHFCETIYRHAVATTERNDTQGWKSSSYWICTFSNNQYQIGAELGFGDHKQSSFYKALHSGVCRGTCMVMDEQALPLTRSWCLFELLQTMNLEQTQENFQGLLFCTMTGVLNYGEADFALSMNIGNRLATLKLEDADATRQEDKDMISSLVLQEAGCFKSINKSLRLRIESALLVCKKCVEEEFSQIVEQMQDIGTGRMRRSTSTLRRLQRTVTLEGQV